MIKRKDGEVISKESVNDLIIEGNGILYPVEIKLSSNPTADMTQAFMVLDKIENKKRGVGAIICIILSTQPHATISILPHKSLLNQL